MAWRGRRLGLLLASSSTAALLIGGGAPAAFAACANGAGAGTGFDNPVATTTPCVAVTNTSFTGNITNEGTVAPGGITFTNGTMTGFISSSGNILGGINIDANSVIAHTGTGIAITGSTFLGGITNAGTISAGAVGVGVGFAKFIPTPTSFQVSPAATFTGGITNSGTISAGSAGIWVMAAGSFAGGITNAASGVIAAPGGIRVGFGTITGGAYTVSSFGGGITNQGVISAATSGIAVNGVSTFTGGISNSGTISVSGFFSTGISVENVGTFSGGISNSGTIFAGATGIHVCGCVTTFLGGIANSGLISASSAGISVGSVSTFGGGINNSGTISAGFGPGIEVAGVDTFSGGISNSGTISAAFGPGIEVGFVETFSGGISNSGTISAAFGVGIEVGFVETFSGGISNSGTISAGGFSKVGGGAISVVGVSVFDGGVANSGTLAGGGIFVLGVDTFLGGISNSGTITVLGGKKGPAIVVSSVSVFGSASAGGGISNTGTIAARNTGIRVIGVDTFFGGISNGGTISAGFTGIRIRDIGSFGGGISNGGLIAISHTNSSVGIVVDNISLFTGGVRNSGTITGAGVGIAVGECGCGISTFTGGVTNAGLISVGFAGILIGNVSTFSGDVSNAGTINASGAGILVNGASFAGGHIVNTGTINAAVAIDVSGALTAMTIDQNAGLLQGDINLSANGDTLYIRGGTINGNINGVSGSGGTLNFALGAGTFTYGPGYSFSSIDLVNVNSGIVILNGNNDATRVAVNGGVLQVGDAANPAATLSVVAGLDVIGGALAGHGTVIGDVAIESGGVLAPGGSIGTLTIAGTLTFNPGSIYALQIAPGAGNNSATIVTGSGIDTATINGGKVVVVPQLGHYNATTYTILTATGGVSGTFSSLAFGGPFGFTGTSSLSYDANDVFLNLAGNVLLAVNGTNQNQQNVVNGINNAIIGGATLPTQFLNLGDLTDAQLLKALTLLSGENSAGFFQGALQAGNSFLNLLVNPFLDGRFGGGGGFGAAMGFAAEEPPALPQAAAAFASAMPVKAPPAPATFGQRFSVWGTAYGGSGRVLGDPFLGSHDTTAHAAAFAAGIDYRLSPDTVVGFALAGGGTSWGLTAGLGGGSSDMFQAGDYGSHRWGAAYLSGAVAYNFHDVTTNRTVTIAGTDMLQARFQANGVGARVESGYRYATPWLGFSPYAAAQVQSIALPNYGEIATAGSNQFALNFASQTATTTRTELGAWLDRSRHMDGGALLTLYGRAAWAHDFGNSPSASAIFQALPGSSFVVNGAIPAHDGALVTGAAQYSLPSGWSFLAKFDGEFSSTTSIYTGSGMVKKVW